MISFVMGILTLIISVMTFVLNMFGICDTSNIIFQSIVFVIKWVTVASLPIHFLNIVYAFKSSDPDPYLSFKMAGVVTNSISLLFFFIPNLEMLFTYSVVFATMYVIVIALLFLNNAFDKSSILSELAMYSLIMLIPGAGFLFLAILILISIYNLIDNIRKLKTKKGDHI